MSIRTHIVFMFVATILAWLGWILVITNVDPYAAAWWGVGLFYSTFFLALFGSFTVIGYTIRSIFQMKRQISRLRLITSIRQAFLWSAALSVALVLQSQRLLSWWVFVLVIAIFVLIEFIIFSLQERADEDILH